MATFGQASFSCFRSILLHLGIGFFNKKFIDQFLIIWTTEQWRGEGSRSKCERPSIFWITPEMSRVLQSMQPGTPPAHPSGAGTQALQPSSPACPECILARTCYYLEPEVGSTGKWGSVPGTLIWNAGIPRGGYTCADTHPPMPEF